MWDYLIKVHKKLRCSYLQSISNKVYWTENASSSLEKSIKKIQELNHIKNLVFCDNNQLEFVNYRHN